MKKMPCVFQRDFSEKRNPKTLDLVTPGCEWVLAGEGGATRKWDGTACLVRNGLLFKRYDAKRGKQPPPGFEPCQPDADPVTGHWPGWVPVDVVNPDPADVWHALAWAQTAKLASPWLPDGTYELVGPRINGNSERLKAHEFVRHGATGFNEVFPRTFEGIQHSLSEMSIEGVVFWRDLKDPDCDKAKIRRDDFGLSWPAREGVK